MGGTASVINVSVVNKTPYTWSFATQDRGYRDIGPNSTKSYEETRADAYIRIRYKNQQEAHFSFKSHTSFIISESSDRSQIQIHCTSTNKDCYCPKPGKFLQTCHFWTTLYSQKYTPQYVLVQHLIQN